jgi:phage terminase small subunit
MKKTRKKPAEKAAAKWEDRVGTLRERIVSSYQFDAIGMQLLENGLDAYARMLQAGAILAREGTIVKDRFGQPKPHPAFEQESSSRLAMLRHFRALGVDMGDVAEESESEE